MMQQYVIFDLDENGNEINHIYLTTPPDKIYEVYVDEYGELRDSYRKLTDIECAMKMREALYTLANNYAMQKQGSAAVMLHEACNAILRANRLLKGYHD